MEARGCVVQSRAENGSSWVDVLAQIAGMGEFSGAELHSPNVLVWTGANDAQSSTRVDGRRTTRSSEADMDAILRHPNLHNRRRQVTVIGVRTANDVYDLAVNVGYENATNKLGVVFLRPGGDWVLQDSKHLTVRGYAAVLGALLPHYGL